MITKSCTDNQYANEEKKAPEQNFDAYEDL